MDQEATIPDSSPETTSDISSEPSVESKGTADNSEISTGANDEPSFSKPTISFDDIPEEQRSIIEAKSQEIDRHFKRELTRMRQEDKAQSRLISAKLEQAEREKNELTRIAAEVLKDPSKLEMYRNQLGPQLGIETQAPQIETLEDLVKYTQLNAETAANKRIQQEINAINAQRQAERLANQYNAALTKLKTEDPRYQHFEKAVAALVKEPEYQKLYDGSNEYDVLKLAYSDLIGKFTPELEKVKDQTISQMKMKKSATTFSPQKTVATEGKATGRSKEEIIAAVQAKLGAPQKGVGTVSSRR